MPHSPRRIQRRTVIVQQPVLYDPSHRSRTRHASHTRSRSRSSQRSLPRAEPPPAPVVISRRTYRYHRVGRGKGSSRNRKLAYCLALAILVLLALVASGLYVYYFVDRRSERAIQVPVLPSTPAPTKVAVSAGTEPVNITETGPVADDGPLMNDTIEEVVLNVTEIMDVPPEMAPEGHKEVAIEDAFYYSERVCIENERNRECVAGSGAELDICSQVWPWSMHEPHAGTCLPACMHQHQTSLSRVAPVPKCNTTPTLNLSATSSIPKSSLDASTLPHGQPPTVPSAAAPPITDSVSALVVNVFTCTTGPVDSAKSTDNGRTIVTRSTHVGPPQMRFLLRIVPCALTLLSTVTTTYNAPM